ncbi:hypothetical protein NPIL_685721 [Nephila pilipes]|uniref:Uncharacterized protein n=1 Tax=Nephila pilipes TaxID=299642 RepID=A0A8X6P323_NEPPI|nr:hypothetical protein NPIL_685721 [Nephila pilipes]
MGYIIEKYYATAAAAETAKTAAMATAGKTRPLAHAVLALYAFWPVAGKRDNLIQTKFCINAAYDVCLNGSVTPILLRVYGWKHLVAKPRERYRIPHVLFTNTSRDTGGTELTAHVTRQPLVKRTTIASAGQHIVRCIEHFHPIRLLWPPTSFKACPSKPQTRHSSEPLSFRLRILRRVILLRNILSLDVSRKLGP